MALLVTAWVLRVVNMNCFSREHLLDSRLWFVVDHVDFLMTLLELTGTKDNAVRRLVEFRLASEAVRRKLFAVASAIARRLDHTNPWQILNQRIPGLALEFMDPSVSKSHITKLLLAQTIQSRVSHANVCLILASGHLGFPGAAVGIPVLKKDPVLYFGMEPWRREIGLGRDGTIDHECIHLTQEVIAGALTKAADGTLGFWRRYRCEFQAHIHGNPWLLIVFFFACFGLLLAPILLRWVEFVVTAVLPKQL